MSARRLVSWKTGRTFEEWHVLDRGNRMRCGARIPPGALVNFLDRDPLERPPETCQACWPVPQPAAAASPE